ncbi:histidine phosphatase family protein [Kitasatospora sp. NPDC049285]|uniref:histidine phosphatase family protein n=1 Tax=Kitasatospora sp. NPDC049285 TaxID=3157096 RepID=UPI00343BD7ED
MILVAPAFGAEQRSAAFGDDRPLTDAELAPARGLPLPAGGRVVAAPAPRCRQTAEALGLDAAVEPALGDLDPGRWRGRALAEVAEREPESLTSWLTDPHAPAPGGESVGALCARVGTWLDALPDAGGTLLAVAEPAAIRATVVHALALPPASFWRLDVRPLTATHLTGRAGRWNLRCGEPLRP